MFNNFFVWVISTIIVIGIGLSFVDKPEIKCSTTDYALFLAGQKEIQIHFDTPKRLNITYVFKRVQNITNLFSLHIDGEKDGLLSLDGIFADGSNTIINLKNKWGYFEFTFDKSEKCISIDQFVNANKYLNIEETRVTFELP